MIYLDNASTSYPKPVEVIEAVSRCLVDVAGSSGRGAHAGARRAARIVEACRDAVAELLDAERPESIVFTHNATDALNLAIRGTLEPMLRRGEKVHVVASALDHNSVRRPIEFQRQLGADVTMIEPDERGVIAPASICNALRADTRLVILVQASNVSGIVQPAAQIAALCGHYGVPVLLDATQTLGHMPVSVREFGVSMLAFSGHKGLLGPTGTGGLYIRPEFEGSLEPLRTGGTGSDSESPSQPGAMPERFEAGTSNVAGLAGLEAGARWVRRALGENGIASEQAAIDAFVQRLREAGIGDDGFASSASERSLGVEIVGGLRRGVARVGVFSFRHASADVHQAAAMLESTHGVVVRAGLHCAPGASGGSPTLRASFSPFVSASDAARAAEAIMETFRVLASGEASGPR